MTTTRSNIMDSRSFEINGIPVMCYRNKFGRASIAWSIKTQGEWATYPMTKASIKWVLANL